MVELVKDVGVTLINASASDDMVAMAAWVSHDADSEERLKNIHRKEKLIGFLYRAKHMSPFEHGHFTFKVDVPLFVAREFMRHRTASYNEVSGRYTEMQPRFYAGNIARVQRGKPGDYYFEDGTDEQTAIYIAGKHKALQADWELYTERLGAGIAKEQAREELPLSLMTQFYVTMNPRNLMQFLTLRNDKHALKEIRDVAVKMEAVFAEHMPITYKAYLAGRGQETVDVEALQQELENFKSRADANQVAIKKLQEDNQILNEKLRTAEALRDEAVTKYNGLYSSLKDTQSASADDKPFSWSDVTDAVLGERPKNDVNIVINAIKQNPEEIARLIQSALRENRHRRHRT